MNSMFYFIFITFCLCYGWAQNEQDNNTIENNVLAHSSTDNIQANYTTESVQANNCSTEYVQPTSSADSMQANYTTEYVQANNSSAQCNSSTDNMQSSYSSENVQANWSPCKYENGTEVPTESEAVEIYVTNCTRNEPICQFRRGASPLLNITFKPKLNSNSIERGILAKMYMATFNKYVNIPYGSLWNPCETMKNLNTSETNCLSNGILKDNIYNSVSEFKVNEDFPQVSDITVRIIFRQKNNSRRISSLRKWDKHPGPMFLCVEVLNCAVV